MRFFTKKSFLSMMLSCSFAAAVSSHAAYLDAETASINDFIGGGSSGQHKLVNWGTSYAYNGTKSLYLRSFPGSWYAAGANLKVPAGVSSLPCYATLWVRGESGALNAIDPTSWTYMAPIVYRNSSWSNPGGWMWTQLAYGSNSKTTYIRYSLNNGKSAVIDNLYTSCEVLH